jgi:hypothetical protein
MVTIGEALYARTARGLSFAEAFEIVRRGLSDTSHHPPEWDVLRSFADAGWFDLTLLRSYPARRILQRAVTSETIDPNAVLMSGPMPLAVIDHINQAANAEGAILETYAAASQWSLPRYVVRADDPSRLRRLIRNLGLASPVAKLQAGDQQGDLKGVHGYDVIARLDEERGFFSPQDGGHMEEGLYRLERKETHNPFLYRSVISGLPEQNFVSPTLAILSHHSRKKRTLFVYDGVALVGLIHRVSLPSSWARWASDLAMCNAGPIFANERWRYLYPMPEAAVSALSKFVSIARRGEDKSPWIGRLLASASNRHRAIFDARLGKVRIISGAPGKRS